MPHGDTAKRWRLRFSVRTMAIIVALVGAYFGAWERRVKLPPGQGRKV